MAHLRRLDMSVKTVVEKIAAEEDAEIQVMPPVSVEDAGAVEEEWHSCNGDDDILSVREHHPFLGGRTTLLLHTVPIRALNARVNATFRNVWERPVWKQRRALWAQFQHFAANYGFPMSYNSVDVRHVLMFIESRQWVPPRRRRGQRRRQPATSSITWSAATAAKNVGHFVMMFRRLGRTQDVQILDDYRLGLRSRIAQLDKTHAVPMTAPFVARLIAKIDNDNVTAMIWVWFITASRWQDLQDLTWEDLALVDGGKAVLITFRRTKTNQEADSRIDHLTVVNSQLVPAEVMERIGRTDRIVTWSEYRMTKHLKELPLPQAHRNQFVRPRRALRQGWTLHSVKMGAARHAWEKAADPRTGVEHWQVGVLLKHKNVASLYTSDTSVEYAPEPENLVRSLKTEKLTNALAKALNEALHGLRRNTPRRRR